MSAGWCIERDKGAKSSILNVSYYIWTCKDEMNRFTFSAIFLCGVVFAVSFTFLSEYFKARCCDVNQYSIPRAQQKAFSPLPDDSQLLVPDEGTLGLVLRKTDVVNKPEKKNSGMKGENQHHLVWLSSLIFHHLRYPHVN
jgi:hypothetical protein